MYVFLNQKGFIMPLTMMLCFLFPLIVISEVEMYKIEQLFLFEEEEVEKLQSLSQIGMQDLYDIIMEQSFVEAAIGKLYYPIGWIEYSIEPTELNIVLITGTSYTDAGRRQYFTATVNLATKEIEKWVEE